MTTPDGSSPGQIESIEALLALVTLEDVRTYSFSAEATAPPVQEQERARVEFEYSQLTTPRELHDRFRLQVSTADAIYQVDIGAVFSISAEYEIPEAIRTDFAERVGFMAAFPYIREAVSGLAARLRRQAPLFDIMRPGDLKITSTADLDGEG